MRKAIIYYERELTALVPCYLLPRLGKDFEEDQYYLYGVILQAIYSQMTYRSNLNVVFVEKLVRNMYQEESRGLLYNPLFRKMISVRLFTFLLYKQ